MKNKKGPPLPQLPDSTVNVQVRMKPVIFSTLVTDTTTRWSFLRLLEVFKKKKSLNADSFAVLNNYNFQHACYAEKKYMNM